MCYCAIFEHGIHNPEGTGTSHYYFKEGTYYTIPYRSLMPKNIKNLLAAGRCISGSPLATWKKCTLENVTAKEMLQPIFRQGKLVYQLPDIQQIRSHCKQQVDTLWDEVKRFENPHNYYVDLSQKLWDIKNDLLAGLQQHLN